MTQRVECQCNCGCSNGINYPDNATVPAKPKCSQCMMGVHLDDR